MFGKDNDAEIYKNIFLDSGKKHDENLMGIKIYCSVSKKNMVDNWQEFSRKIFDYAMSLQSEKFTVHFCEREHPFMEDDGGVRSAMTILLYDDSNPNF